MAVTGIVVPETPDKVAELQFQYAWEHFKFHAEQRMKMFDFFLIVAGGILAAWGVIVNLHNSIPANPEIDIAGVLIPAFGAIYSTFFLALDTRNTQLLEMSENVLTKMEEAWIYSGSAWRRSTEYGEVRLGILYREELLKKHVKKKRNYCAFQKILFVDNIKHKTAIRAILIISIAGFWFLAASASPAAGMLRSFVFAGAVFSAVWGIGALYSPVRDLKREAAAWAARHETPKDPRPSASPRSRKSSSSRARRGKR